MVAGDRIKVDAITSEALASIPPAPRAVIATALQDGLTRVMLGEETPEEFEANMVAVIRRERARHDGKEIH